MLTTTQRWLFTLGATLAYLALAVAGFGSLGRFFANPARSALAIVCLAMAIAAMFVGGNISPGVREDRGNRWVLWAFTIIGVALGYVPARTDRLGVWCLDGETVRWIGVALFAIGGVLRLWPVAVLGNRFSGLVAIQPGHHLVTSGIYSVIRHPSYLGALVFSLGWSLAFRSAAGVLLTAAMLIPLLSRIAAEERLLASEFGAEYAAYRARTARMLPGIW